MKTQRRNKILISLVILTFSVGMGVSIYLQFGALFGFRFGSGTHSLERGKVLAAADYRYSGPYSQDNLTVYLIHGEPTLSGKSFLTLQEALEQKKIVVHETGEVNSLAIENISDEEVFIQSGDVVKGGQQDRTFPYDFLAPAQSGPILIEAFCVEQERWGKRGDEKSDEFSSSCFSVSSKKFKVAAMDRSQENVWANVSEVKRKLSSNLGQVVDSSESTSSYQLALENPSLQTALNPYLEALRPAIQVKKDALGVVVLVNGKITSADVYASTALFARLWPKLVQGAAVEAFADLKKGQKFQTVSLGQVKLFLRSAERGTAKTEAVTERVYVRVQQGDKQMLFDTCDRQNHNLVLHRSILAR